MTRFVVADVFDLRGRGGLLVSGTVLEGVVSAGMVLREETTGRQVTVLGVEFQGPRDRRTGTTTLVLARAAAEVVVAGQVLTTPGPTG